MIDTDNRFCDYCTSKRIQNPFRIDYQVFITNNPTDEEIEWEKAWKEKRDKYLQLAHTFQLWDFHFWMDWTTFERHCRLKKNYTDVSIYMPCDCAERQCNMACAYFGSNCPRQEGEIKIPEMLGFEGRWEFTDYYDC